MRAPIRLSVVGLVFRKEMRETLRDRRTLFVMIVLPILLYPLLMLGLTAVTAKRIAGLEHRRHRVVVETASERFRTFLDEADGIEVVTAGEDPTRAVRDGTAEAAIRTAPDLDEALARGETSPVELLFSQAEERSLAARAAVRKVLADFRDAVLAERLGRPELLAPIESEEVDVSGVSGASMLAARVLGMLLTVMMLTAAFYPAVDLGAGEKERGTLETLLVAPVGRAEIVLGKYGTVLTVSIGAALLNLVAMGLTFGRLAEALPNVGPGGFSLGAGEVAAMLLLLLPLGALFSAASLALSAFARSYKEGMHYLTPLAVVVMPLALVSVIPDVRLDAGLALVPVSGSVLLFRDLLLGKATWLHGVLAFGSTAAVAAALLRWCVGLFRREEILFRPTDAGGIRTLLAAARRRGAPGGEEAAFLFGTGLALMWLLAGRLFPGHLVAAHVATQVLVIAAPPVAYALLVRFRLRETFRLRVGRPRALVAAVLLGPALAVLLTEAWVRLGGASGEAPERIEEALAPLLAQPLVVRLLLLAALPAICEELLFRGFVLTGVRRSTGPVVSVIVVGVLFGVYHLSPERIPVTAAVGAVLAVIALRAGSILAPMLAHATYNGTLVALTAGVAPAGLLSTGGGVYSPLTLAAAGFLATAGALLLLVGDRPAAGAGQFP